MDGRENRKPGKRSIGEIRWWMQSVLWRGGKNHCGGNDWQWIGKWKARRTELKMRLD